MFKVVMVGNNKTGKRTIFKNINSPFISIENIGSMLGA